MEIRDMQLKTPPTREVARAQFDHWTEKLNLVHTFTFDEMYDWLEERRARKVRTSEFRDKIISFESKLREVPGSMGANPFPLTHTFADGMYVRQVTVPARALTVTKIHAQTHPFFLLKGTISILTEDGVMTHTAPYSGITKAGTKRIIFHHDEVVLTTVQRTNHTDLDKIEGELIAKDFGELEAGEQIKIDAFVEQIKNLCPSLQQH